MIKRLRFPLLLLMILGSICGPWRPVLAAAPVDHRGLGPNHSSELPGAGYLLTDPYQGASQAYWAGAYRTIAGQRSYCIDDYYDYPDPRYGYVTTEAAGWPGRPGSNLGANGHTAQRIAWIVNRYGASNSPSVDAAVSMAINLLMGSAPFDRSYHGYFRPQLDAIDPNIGPAIDRMIRDSDRLAGPYRTELRLGPAPAVGGSGSFTVLVRSALGTPVPHAEIAIATSPGLVLQSRSLITTGDTGVAKLHYTATRSGPFAVTAAGREMPNSTIRIGYSPSHNTGGFRGASQRVALISAHPLVPIGGVTAHLTVRPAALHTVVDHGSTPRQVGALVTDHVLATGLAPRSAYRLTVLLRDRSGLSCGSKVAVVRADVHGHLDLHTAALPVCGAGTNTFAERLTVGPVTVAVSAPGQPAETFPVTPTIETAVVGGTGARSSGAAVADQVTVTGLAPGPVKVLAVLLDDTGRTCAHVSVPTASDHQGRLALTTPALNACGQTRDTFVEQVLDQKGTVLVASKPWLPAETFPLKPPAPPSSTTPPSSTPPSSTPPSQSVPSSPAPSSPAPSRPVPSPSRPTPPTAATPPPHLAMTGSGTRLALVGGLFSIGVGGLVLIASRRA